MLNYYSDDQLRLAAQLYYIEGMGQHEVAKFVKVSQSKISRMLTLARERGIVRITVSDYDPRNRELEAKLQATLRLRKAVVIKTSVGSGAMDLRRAVGLFAAPALASILQRRNILALSGGRTMHELVKNLPIQEDKDLTVIQAMGSVDSSISVFDAQELGRELTRRLGGAFHSMNIPAHLDNRKMRDDLLALEQIRRVHENLRRANVALVGLGTLQNSVFIERKVLGEKDIEELESKGAVGEVCGRFYDAMGRECDTPWRDRVMSLALDTLRSIPLVMGVVSGQDRSESILAAINGGFLKGLIIDDCGARALLELSEK